jgi:hypothetical protein
MNMLLSLLEKMQQVHADERLVTISIIFESMSNAAISSMQLSLILQMMWLIEICLDSQPQDVAISFHIANSMLVFLDKAFSLSLQEDESNQVSKLVCSFALRFFG